MDAAAITEYVPRQPMIRHMLVAVLAGIVLWYLTTQLTVGARSASTSWWCAGGWACRRPTDRCLGHGAFMAVGAPAPRYDCGQPTAEPIHPRARRGGRGGGGGLVVGLPATRLKGPYLAGMTLLFALAVPSIADKWPATFGGDQGLTVSRANRARVAGTRGVADLDPDPGRG